MKKVFVAVFLIAGVALALEIVRDAYLFFTPNSADPVLKIVLIEPGRFAKTAQQLYNQGLIRDPKRFIMIAKILRVSANVKVGEYEMRMNMSPYQLLKVMTSGKSVLHPVSIPEGYNLDQIAEVLASKNLVQKDEFLKLARDPHMAHLLGIDEDTLEGYLYPDTYSFTHFIGDRVILKTMVEKFKEVYDREIKFSADRAGMSLHDVVTLASMIEKETGAPEERPLISSVFHNRLKIGMKLQSDPTVIYGKVGDKTNITKKDLVTPNAYNTYVIKGLPIGPISSPGKDSLLAAVEPAQTKYLYFVSRNDGTQVFSGDYSQHRAAVVKYQLDPKMRKNRSWRDRLKKKKPAPPDHSQVSN